MIRCQPGAAHAVACVCLGPFRLAPARADGSVWAFGAILPGTATEIADFAAADTVLLLVGANDYFGVLSAASGSAIAVVAENTRVTGDIVADADRLAALGARTLVVLNVPDLGPTPRYLGDATATALSAGTDAALPTLLAPLATGGRNVYLVDLSTLLREAVANPARSGLTDVTHACNAEPSCLAADTAMTGSVPWFATHSMPDRPSAKHPASLDRAKRWLDPVGTSIVSP